MICDTALVINKNDVQKISEFYENKTIKEIIEMFKGNCDIVKNNLTEAKFELESSIK